VNGEARVAYVDIDPIVVGHASALLVDGPSVIAVGADLASPADVLANPDVATVIDLSEPVCVILASVLHFIDPETAAQLVAEYTRRVPSESWIVVSVATTDDEEFIERARGSYTMSAWNHGAREIEMWLDGLKLVPPGVTEVRRWTSGIDDSPKDNANAWYVLGAAGVKP